MEEPVSGPVAAVVLAAGASERMGRNKLLLPYRGGPLVRAALSAAAGSSAEPVVCVLGHEAAAVRSALRQEPGLERVLWVVNDDFARGRSTSIRAGLRAVPAAAAAALFLPGDVPGVDTQQVEAVLRRFRETGASVVVAVEESGERSHPLLFARPLFPRLMALEGDAGGRALLESHWEEAEKVARRGEPLGDVDTPQDYARLLEVAS